MRYIKYSFVATMATIFGFQSCDLTEYNPSGSTAEVVLSTPAGITGLANSIYYNYRWKYFGREDPVLYLEGGTDLWFNFNCTSYGDKMSQYKALDWDTGQFNTLWERQYDVINLCNTGIERIKEVEFPNPKEKLYREGEFRFMRAYSYWWLVEFFGDIVLRTQETQTPEMNAYRTPASQIYDEVIIPDLQAACNLLEVEPIDGMAGRATRKAAYGALARIALTRAAYGDADKYNQIALDAAKYVIENQSALKCALYDKYGDLFHEDNNKTNKEALFVQTFSTNPSYNPDGNPNRLCFYYSPAYESVCGMSLDMKYGRSAKFDGSGGSMYMMPTKYLLKLFKEGDARYESTFLEAFKQNAPTGWTWTDQMQTTFKKPANFVGNVKINNGDTALWFTRQVVPKSIKDSKPYAIVDLNDVYTQETEGYGEIIKNADMMARFYPKLYKYWDTKRTTLTTASYHDVILMRLGEMYLIAAEANIALRRPDAAVPYITTLRVRATKPGHNAEMAVTAADMTLDFILEERARELCGEHLRWFDLKRTGKLVSNINKYNKNITSVREFHNLRPIPRAFLLTILNASEFGQNPGYTKP